MCLRCIDCIVENTATPPRPLWHGHIFKKQSPINGLANRGRVVRPIAMKGEEVRICGDFSRFWPEARRKMCPLHSPPSPLKARA